jgi:prepilin-type N-terminal cleavage/methylation domain-containing protein
MSDNQRGFTLIEMLVVVLAVVLALAMILPVSARSGGAHIKTYSATYLRGIGQAIFVYEVANRASPRAGNTDLSGEVQGFRGWDVNGRAFVAPSDPEMVNNLTASLWLLVRDGSLVPVMFINPATDDREFEPAMGISDAYDFEAAEQMSYSFINMYHERDAAQWNAPTSNWVLAADKSDQNHAMLHTHSWPPSGDLSALPPDWQLAENSPNYGFEGQHALYGDGHVDWVDSPFAGPGNDNIYAQIDGGSNAPPTLGNRDGDRATNTGLLTSDVVLMPVAGNNGISLSGESGYSGPMTVGTTGRTTTETSFAIVPLLALVAAVVGLLIWFILTGRRSDDATPSNSDR